MAIVFGIAFVFLDSNSIVYGLHVFIKKNTRSLMNRRHFLLRLMDGPPRFEVYDYDTLWGL